MKSIAYLKHRFLTNDNDCWVMLVRDGSIEVYCECIIEDEADNMNLVQNMENAIDNIAIGYVPRADPLPHLEAH